jgi:hypothetical protein
VNYFTFGNAEYFTKKTPQLVADDIQGSALIFFSQNSLPFFKKRLKNE